MTPLLAAILSATTLAQTTAPQALAGVTLGSDAKTVAAQHKGVAFASEWGPTWAWNDPRLGAVRVTADEDGNVGIVDVVLARTSRSIDLPSAQSFAVDGGRAQYAQASAYVESDSCTPSGSAASCFAYTLDGGELVLQFGPNGAGPLHEVIWGDRSLLKNLHVIAPGSSL